VLFRSLKTTDTPGGSMASLKKITIPRYLDRNGKQVPKGTKGARKVKEESSKYYGIWKEGGKNKKVALSTDKDVSRAMLTDLLRARARGEAGLTDPYKDNLDRPVTEHVNDYLAVLESTTRSVDYHREARRILTTFVDTAKVKTLRDITADTVSTYLARMKTGPTTKNYHRRLIVMLMNWCEG